MVKNNDVLHKVTYVWKEEEKCAIVIKNNGEKIILDPLATDIWKRVNDEKTVEEIINESILETAISKERGTFIISGLIDIDILTNEDLFWGDDLL